MCCCEERVGLLFGWQRPGPLAAPIPLTLALSHGGERGLLVEGYVVGEVGLLLGW